MKSSQSKKQHNLPYIKLLLLLPIFVLLIYIEQKKNALFEFLFGGPSGNAQVNTMDFYYHITQPQFACAMRDGRPISHAGLIGLEDDSEESPRRVFFWYVHILFGQGIVTIIFSKGILKQRTILMMLLWCSSLLFNYSNNSSLLKLVWLLAVDLDRAFYWVPCVGNPPASSHSRLSLSIAHIVGPSISTFCYLSRYVVLIGRLYLLLIYVCIVRWCWFFSRKASG